MTLQPPHVPSSILDGGQIVSASVKVEQINLGIISGVYTELL